MITRIQDMHNSLLFDLPGMNEVLPLLNAQICDACREFCRETEAWREKLTFNILDSKNAYDVAYAAAVAAGQSTDAAKIAGDAAELAALKYVLKPHYDADVIRPWKVWSDHSPDTALVDVSQFDFDVATATLRFRSQLRTYSPTATTWATTTTYAAGDYAINTAVRYLCAIAHESGTFATDLAAGKWVAMPNDLVVIAVMQPHSGTVELASWFMEKWGNAIIAKTKVLCMAMKDKKWSSPERVSHFDAIYMDECAKAKRERFTEDLSQGLMIHTMSWVP
jgi:hypothetical protein